MSLSWHIILLLTVESSASENAAEHPAEVSAVEASVAAEHPAEADLQE